MPTFAISFAGKVLGGDATVTAETQEKALVALHRALKKVKIKELYIYTIKELPLFNNSVHIHDDGDY